MNTQRLFAEFERLSEAPDAVQRLRRLILDLAVRGKLVEQSADDAPADELIASIDQVTTDRLRASYRTLIAEPILGDEIPFALPATWMWARLGRISDLIQRGKAPSYSEDGGPLVVSQKCVRWEGLQLAHARHITEESLSGYQPERFLRDGDLLWNSTGTGTIGRVARLTDTPERLVCDGHVTVVRCSRVAAEYIRIWLRTDHVYGRIEDRASGSTNQVELTLQMALAQTVPLPPLAEQHRIVAKVDDLLTLCDQLEAAQTERERWRDRLVAASLHHVSAAANAEEFKHQVRFFTAHPKRLLTRPEHVTAVRTAVLDAAVRGRLVPQDRADEPANTLLERIQEGFAAADGVSKRRPPRLDIDESAMPFRLPPGWEWVRLQSICSSITDGDHQPPPKSESGIPFLVIGNVRTRSIDFANCRRASPSYYENLDSIHKPRRDDVLYTLVGSYGIPVLVPGDQPFCVQRHIGILRPSAHVDATFLARVLDSGLVFGQATACATGIAQKTVPLSGLRKICMPLPPVAEQRRIVAKVDEVMKVCDGLERSLTAMQMGRAHLLEAVLYEALTEGGLDSERALAGGF